MIFVVVKSLTFHIVLGCKGAYVDGLQGWTVSSYVAMDIWTLNSFGRQMK
jgi:hypothetical protein